MQLVDRDVPAQKRTPEATAAAASPAPAGPPVAGNIASPEVNLPPVDVSTRR